MCRRMVLAGISILLVPVLAHAQPAAVRLSLDEAISRGLATSRRLADLRARQAAAEAEVDIRAADTRPMLAIQAGYQRTSHIDPFGVVLDGRFREIFPDIPDNYRTRLDLQWPIFTGGRGDALERAARAEVSASAAELAAAQADLRLELTRAYWALVTARDTVRVVEQALERARAHLKDMRARLDAGLVAPNEALTIEAQESRQRALLIDARNRYEVTALALRRLVGVGLETSIELVEPLAPPPPAYATGDALGREAHGSRPERRVLESQTAAAAARRRAAAAGWRPDILVTGGVDYARPNNRILPRRAAWHESWDLGINVHWSLWDAGRTRAQVAQAAAREDAAQKRLEDFDTMLAVEVRQHRLTLDAAVAAIGASEDAVRSAAEARRVVAERFAAGVATSTEELDAQVVLLQAELDRTRALADARLAEAQLLRALGR